MQRKWGKVYFVRGKKPVMNTDRRRGGEVKTKSVRPQRINYGNVSGALMLSLTRGLPGRGEKTLTGADSGLHMGNRLLFN